MEDSCKALASSGQHLTYDLQEVAYWVILSNCSGRFSSGVIMFSSNGKQVTIEGNTSGVGDKKISQSIPNAWA